MVVMALVVVAAAAGVAAVVTVAVAAVIVRPQPFLSRSGQRYPAAALHRPCMVAYVRRVRLVLLAVARLGDPHVPLPPPATLLVPVAGVCRCICRRWLRNVLSPPAKLVPVAVRWVPVVVQVLLLSAVMPVVAACGVLSRLQAGADTRVCGGFERVHAYFYIVYTR